MKKNTDEAHITLCCKRIEERLNWGDSTGWTNQDFENLSEKIREATGVTLSGTTLKRIWGRVKYESAPTVTTLNTLAQFLGYENWRTFRQENGQEREELQTDRSISPSAPSRKKPGYIWIAAAAGIIIIAILGFNYIRGKKPVNAAEYRFSSRKTVTEGLPNTVIFDYNAESAPEDSVFIQQNWDPSRRVKVSRLQHQATSVYYYPGHFRAKLVVGDQIVKEHSLTIKTKGWLPMIEQTPVPVYFKEEEALSNGELGLTTQQIRDKNITLQPEAPWVRYSNIGNWGPLTTARFRFEAELRNDFGEGSAVCRMTQVFLLCEGGAIAFPLADKGCISELNIMLPDSFISGKSNDLSGFGVDAAQWVKVRCEAENGQIKMMVNDKLAYQAALSGKTLKIAGITFRFQGTGKVRNVTLTDL
jgi:hypothetical protein